MKSPVNASSNYRLTRGYALVRAFVVEEDGQDLIEYAFVAAFIGIAGYVVLNGIGPEVGATYNAWLDPSTGTPSLWEAGEPWTSAGS